jgi:hypothetical protein
MVWGVGLRPITCWDCGLESHWMNWYVSLLSVVCCQVEIRATGWSLVQRRPTECGVCMSECDPEFSRMRRPWPARVVEPRNKNKSYKKSYLCNSLRNSSASVKNSVDCVTFINFLWLDTRSKPPEAITTSNWTQVHANAMYECALTNTTSQQSPGCSPHYCEELREMIRKVHVQTTALWIQFLNLLVCGCKHYTD